MSVTALFYLVGMTLVFVGERLLTGYDGARWTVLTASVVALATAALVEARRMRSATDPGIRLGRRTMLMLMLVGFGSLVLYTGTSDTVIEGLGLEAEAEERWHTSWAALWPIAWLAGTVPFLAIDHVLWGSPVVVPLQRIRNALVGGLVAALGTALVFPINYIAHRNNERWDLTYFKTTAAGTATKNIVASLDTALNVRVFLAPASELADELRGYFSELEGPNLTLEILDQAADPKLARELRVRDNGTIAITRGPIVITEDGETPDPDAPRPMTKTIEVGTDFEQAKRKLKKLDEEVQKVLLELGHGDRVAHVVAGHGELSWEAGGEPEDRMRGLKQLLQAMHFKVESLSMAEGLADSVPDDADLLVIVGPRDTFHEAEAIAISNYIERGGALLIALEPDLPGGDGQVDREAKDPFDAVLERLGVRMAAGVLAGEAGYAPLWHAKRDRMNLVTNRFSVHPSTTVLSENAAALLLATVGAGSLEQVDGATTNVVFTVRSLPIAWADLDGNLEFDSASESKKERPIVAAITGTQTDGKSMRALVLADTGMISDRALGNLANQQFVYDGVNWLIGAEALSGTTESEEDIKIEHTKGDQAAWFYATVIFIPALVLVVGFARVRSRWKGGT